MASNRNVREDGMGPAWETAQARVTLFPCGANTYSPEWFEQITGHPPQRESADREHDLRQAAGPFLDGLLEITASADRVHVKYAPPQSISVVVPTLGPPAKVCQALLGPMAAFVRRASLPALRRAAFGAVALVRAPTAKIALEHLVPLLGTVKIQPGDARDFLYQINRPRHIQIDGRSVLLNRLARWLVAEVVQVTLTTSPDATTLPSKTTRGETVLQVETDVNSDAENAIAISPNGCVDLLTTCCAEGLEIVCKGDRP